MTSIKLKLLLILLVVPLAAFQCAPSPTLDLIVRPQPIQSKPRDISISIDKSQFEKIEMTVQEFASKFTAKKSAQCSPSWWWRRSKEGQCAFFSANQLEGIMVEVFYDTPRNSFRIVLVKDARVFGLFSTREVEEAFNQLVVERLRLQYGEDSVQLSGEPSITSAERDAK